MEIQQRVRGVVAAQVFALGGGLVKLGEELQSFARPGELSGAQAKPALQDAAPPAVPALAGRGVAGVVDAPVEVAEATFAPELHLVRSEDGPALAGEASTQGETGETVAAAPEAPVVAAAEVAEPAASQPAADVAAPAEAAPTAPVQAIQERPAAPSQPAQQASKPSQRRGKKSRRR